MILFLTSSLIMFKVYTHIFVGLQLVIIPLHFTFLFCTLVNNTWFIALSPLAFLASPPLFFVYFLLVPMSIVFLLSFLQFSVFFFFVFEIMASFKVRNYRGILENWNPSTSPGAPSFASSPKWQKDEHSFGVFGPSPVSHKKPGN